MAKKFLMGLLLAAVVGGAAFAQNAGANNWISGELSVVGAGLRYERVLSPKLSVGANAYFNTLILFSDMDAGAFVRFYPWAGKFFLEGQAGFHVYMLLNYAVMGAAVSPGLGWKFDVGKPGGFFVQPGIRVPITLGVVESGDFATAFGVVGYVGMGWAF